MGAPHFASRRCRSSPVSTFTVKGPGGWRRRILARHLLLAHFGLGRRTSGQFCSSADSASTDVLRFLTFAPIRILWTPTSTTWLADHSSPEISKKLDIVNAFPPTGLLTTRHWLMESEYSPAVQYTPAGSSRLVLPHIIERSPVYPSGWVIGPPPCMGAG